MMTCRTRAVTRRSNKVAVALCSITPMATGTKERTTTLFDLVVHCMVRQMSEDDATAKIEAELGELSLIVSGTDEEWVRQTFDEEWAERIGEAGKMAKELRKAHGEFQ